MAYLQYVSPALMTTTAVASLHLTHFLETLINDREREEFLDPLMSSQICTSSYNNRKTETLTKRIHYYTANGVKYMLPSLFVHR